MGNEFDALPSQAIAALDLVLNLTKQIVTKSSKKLVLGVDRMQIPISRNHKYEIYFCYFHTWCRSDITFIERLGN